MAEWRRFDIGHPGQHGGYADLTTGLSIIDGVLDLSDALDLEAAIAHGAAVLKRVGDPSSENVRRARAAGDLARSPPCLDPHDTMHNITEPQEAEPLTAAETVRRHRGHSMPQPRQITLYLHLSADTLTSPDPANGVGCVGRIGNTHDPVHPDQIRDWLSAPNTHITVKPVIDLNQPIAVDAYEIPDRIREHVTLRNPTWVFPLVHPRAERCDLDHTDPYRWDGTPAQTSTDNLAPLCRRHHRLKTFAGWHYQVHDHPGTYQWTSPDNTTYLRDHTGTTEPEPDHPTQADACADPVDPRFRTRWPDSTGQCRAVIQRYRGHERSAGRLVEHPAMTEGVDEDRDPAVGSDFGAADDCGARGRDGGGDRVDVVDGQMKGHVGGAINGGSSDAGRLGLLAHHPAGAVDGQLDVADLAAIHDDRVDDDFGAEHLDVPPDGGAGVDHTEVRGQLAHGSSSNGCLHD